MQSSGTEVKIEAQQAVPWVTMLVIFGMVIVYYMMEPSRMDLLNLYGNVQAASSWMERNAVSAVKVAEFFRDHPVSQFATLLQGPALQFLVCYFPVASLACFTGWQLGLNAWFIWLFGSTVEQKLGPGRYILLVLASMYVPYSLISYIAVRNADTTFFFGALYLITSFIFAGMVFPEEKKINVWFKRSRGEIFQRAPTRDPAAKFKVNKNLFTIVFFLYQIGMFFYCQKIVSGFKSFDFAGLIASAVIGYGLVIYLVWSATGSLKDGPIKLMCIRKYNSILRLDVGHDVAVRGTSMALGLPEDRVRQWVTQQKGKMSVS